MAKGPHRFGYVSCVSFVLIMFYSYCVNSMIVSPYNHTISFITAKALDNVIDDRDCAHTPRAILTTVVLPSDINAMVVAAIQV